MGSFGKILRVTRPSQWVKNSIVYSAPIAAGSINETGTLLKVSLAAIFFIFASSAVYIFNDLKDRELDSLHPVKSLRPLATGKVTTRPAALIGLSSASIALVGSFFVSASVGFILLIYLCVNFLYMTKGKNLAFFELCCVASGFTLRALAGGNASDTSLTFSFLSVVSISALFLVSCKRYSEYFKYANHDFRPVLNAYSFQSLLIVKGISFTGALAMYLVWAFQNNVVASPFSFLSFGIFTLALLRFGYLARLGSCENPTLVLLSDRALVLCITTWLLVYLGAVYG